MVRMWSNVSSDVRVWCAVQMIVWYGRVMAIENTMRVTSHVLPTCRGRLMPTPPDPKA